VRCEAPKDYGALSETTQRHRGTENLNYKCFGEPPSPRAPEPPSPRAPEPRIPDPGSRLYFFTNFTSPALTESAT
jgi:hypothetical protein